MRATKLRPVAEFVRIPPRRQHRGGYLLLAVLVCLVLAGLMLVPMAQRSFEAATAAVTRERQLQLRWGAVSCQQTLLRAAPALFEARQQAMPATPRRDPRSTGTIDVQFYLGGLSFSVRLADEDTKANLNALYHFGGQQAADRFVVQQMRAALRLPIRLRPQSQPVDPADAIAAGQPLPIAFASWGQVFDLPYAQTLLPPPLPIEPATRMVTCWGRGRLNIRRAPEEAVVEVCRPVITDGQTRQMLRSLRDNPLQPLPRVIEQVGIDPDEQALLMELLTEQSSCFSMWITVQSPHHRWQQLSISERNDDGVVRTAAFEF